MTTPDDAVRAQLAEQAQAVTGPAAAATLDLTGAQATAVDYGELLKRLADLEASRAADHAAANPAPVPVDNTLRLDGNAPSWLHEFAAKIEARLSALES